MRGESVKVFAFADSGERDAGNAPIVTESSKCVDDVLIAPGPRADVIESNRPSGVDVVYTLYFPKSFKGSLRGCEVEVYGESFHVVGDPRPFPDHLVPGSRNRVVEVEKRAG